jgi:hypothetical protein
VVGIDVPAMVGGIDVTVTHVSREDTYSIDGVYPKNYLPKSKDDNFLVVSLMTRSDKVRDVRDWAIEVSDESGNNYSGFMVPAIQVKFGESTESEFEFTYLFSVPRSTMSFVLHLPNDVTLELPVTLEKE